MPAKKKAAPKKKATSGKEKFMAMIAAKKKGKGAKK